MSIETSLSSLIISSWVLRSFLEAFISNVLECSCGGFPLNPTQSLPKCLTSLQPFKIWIQYNKLSPPTPPRQSALFALPSRWVEGSITRSETLQVSYSREQLPKYKHKTFLTILVNQFYEYHAHAQLKVWMRKNSRMQMSMDEVINWSGSLAICNNFLFCRLWSYGIRAPCILESIIPIASHAYFGLLPLYIWIDTSN